MPDTTLSAAIKEAYATATPDVIYHTLEFVHPSISAIRLVQGHEDIVAGGLSWIAAAFNLQLPPMDTDGPPQIRIVVDNVSRDLLGAIEAAADTSDPILVRYRAFLESDLSQAQNDPPLELSLTTISVTPQRITGVCTLSPMHNRRWPKKLYTDEEYPGLIRY